MENLLLLMAMEKDFALGNYEIFYWNHCWGYNLLLYILQIYYVSYKYEMILQPYCNADGSHRTMATPYRCDDGS